MTTSEVAAQYKYLQAIDSMHSTMDNIQEAESAYGQLLKTSNAKSKIQYQLRLASLTALKATKVFWPHEKLGFANDSIRQFARIERAVRESGDNELEYEFLLYRGRTFVHFPGFLNKREIAMNDMAQAVALVEQLARPQEELGPLYLEYAQNLKTDGKLAQAKAFAQKALNYLRTSDEIKKANKVLK